MTCATRTPKLKRSMAAKRTKRRGQRPAEIGVLRIGQRDCVATVPFAFVLGELSEMAPHTNPMFGCTAVYVGEKIVLILRSRPKLLADNGVWMATTEEHHASLRTEFPIMRSITALGGGGVTGWQVLPADDDDFEDSVLRACRLILQGDPRIGKVPKPRRRSPGGAAPARRKRK